MPSIGPRSSAMNFTISFWTRFGSFASVRVCPLSGHCGHEFLRQGRHGPQPHSCAAASPLFDHLAGAAEQRPREGKAERLRRLEIDYPLHFCELHNWKISQLAPCRKGSARIASL
jgi:hypothetical protein